MKTKNTILVLLILIVTSCNSTQKTIKEPNDNTITEKYWKLKTLEGKEITMKKNQEREIFITLKTNENRVTGFAGCNTLSGDYTLEQGNRMDMQIKPAV